LLFLLFFIVIIIPFNTLFPLNLFNYFIFITVFCFKIIIIPFDPFIPFYPFMLNYYYYSIYFIYFSYFSSFIINDITFNPFIPIMLLLPPFIFYPFNFFYILNKNGQPLYGERNKEKLFQENIHFFILISVIILIPIMWIPKPLIKYYRHKKKEQLEFINVQISSYEEVKKIYLFMKFFYILGFY
jgi:hypothetical protein